MTHSLSELQDYLDVGQLDPANPDPYAVSVVLEALPALLEVARRAHSEPSEPDSAAFWARAYFTP